MATDTLERLKKILADDAFAIASENVKPAATLSADFGLDEADLVHFWEKLTIEFGSNFSDDVTSNLMTVDDVVKHIDR